MSYNFHCIHEMYILLLPERLVVVYLFALHCVAFNWYEFVLVTEFIAFQLEKKTLEADLCRTPKTIRKCFSDLVFVVLILSVLSC